MTRMDRVPLHWMKTHLNFIACMLRACVCVLGDLWAHKAHSIGIYRETQRRQCVIYRAIRVTTMAIYWDLYRLQNTYIDITKHLAANRPDILPLEPTTSFWVHIIIPSHTIISHKKLFQSYHLIFFAIFSVYFWHIPI